MYEIHSWWVVACRLIHYFSYRLGLARICAPFDNIYPEGTLVVGDNVKSCLLCNECVELSGGKIKINPTKEYLMTVESWGQLDPEEIVQEAVNNFDKQLEEFVELVAKIK